MDDWILESTATGYLIGAGSEKEGAACAKTITLGHSAIVLREHRCLPVRFG